jgi:hypothetical protein
MGNKCDVSGSPSIYEYNDPTHGRALSINNISITLPVSRDTAIGNISNPVVNVFNGNVRFGNFGENNKYLPPKEIVPLII